MVLQLQDIYGLFNAVDKKIQFLLPTLKTNLCRAYVF